MTARDAGGRAESDGSMNDEMPVAAQVRVVERGIAGVHRKLNSGLSSASRARKSASATRAKSARSEHS